ncbi:MAG TPA: PDZ domain-containing protein [Vicinamibacterales bacterium]|nr:PDZ domain-containing protein [Vicinamibacterales bacterium]
MLETSQGPAEVRPRVARRETRLLLTTIAVSVGMLFLLARFRFPDAARQASEPTPAPLERLAARATFDELAAIMADLERRIAPTTEVLGAQTNGVMAYVPAPRLAPARAVAILPGDSRLVSVGTERPPQIAARDAVRELVVVKVPDRPDRVAAMPSAAARPGPRYVAVVEATALGPAVRPVYVGRTEFFAEPRWSDPVLSIAAVQQTLSAGSAVFSLDGTFIGLVADSEGTLTVLPAAVLRAVVNAAPPVPSPRSDLPIDVQPLTAALSKAAGADKGVMVSYVDPSLAGSVDLVPGDVIQSVDGIGVTTVAGFQRVAQSRTPGEAVTLSVVSRGEPHTVALTAVDAEHEPPARTGDLGAVLRGLAGVGSEVVTVEPGGAAGRAGLRQGDIVVSLDQLRAPNPAAVRGAFRKTPAGDSLLVTVRRNGSQRVIAVEKP